MSSEELIFTAIQNNDIQNIVHLLNQPHLDFNCKNIFFFLDLWNLYIVIHDIFYFQFYEIINLILLYSFTFRSPEQ